MKSFLGRFKQIDPAKPDIVTLVVSTIQPDRDGEIILPSAFEAAWGEYKKSGGLFWHHPLMYDVPPDPRVGIGTPVDFRIVGEEVEVDFRMATKSNEWARQLKDLIDDGIQKGVSVGFFDLAGVTIASPRAEIDALPPRARTALLSGAANVVFTAIDWFETSLVTTGCNPGALARALKSAGGRTELRAFLKQLLAESSAETTEEVTTMSTPPSDAPLPAAAPPPTPQAHVKMNHGVRDNAARLREAANTLESSKWYDDKPEDKVETLAGVCIAVGEVHGKCLKSLMEIDPSYTGDALASVTVDLPEAGAKTAAGDGHFKVTKAESSKLTRAHQHVTGAKALLKMVHTCMTNPDESQDEVIEHIKSAHSLLNTASGHLKELLPTDVEEEDEDGEFTAASAPRTKTPPPAAAAATPAADTAPPPAAPDVDASLRTVIAGLFPR